MGHNITKPRQAEEALRESEKRFRDIAENALEWVWEVDATGKYTYSNPVVEKLLGYKPEEVLEKHFYDLFVSEEREELKQAAFAVFRAKQPFREILTRNLHKNGEIVWLSTSGVPILDPKGNLLGYRGADIDITGRQQAEEALRKSEEKYRLLVNQIPAVVFKGFGDWRVTFFDRKIEGLTGYGKEDFDSGKIKWCDLILPEDLDHARSIFLGALKTDQSYVREYRIRKKDGEIRWIQARGQIFCDDQGKVDFVSGVFFDITDRRRAEAALQESEQKLMNIINFLPDATLVIDKEGKVIAWNKAIEEMTGIRAKDMVGRGNYAYALPFYGEARPILIDLVLRSPEEAGAEYSKYLEIERKDTVLWGVAYAPALREGGAYLFGKASVLQDSSGNVVGAIQSIRDITDRKKAEAERLRFSKMESLGILAGGIAHDFNNILTAILGNVTLAMLEGKLEERVQERLVQAEQACLKAQGLAHQLLTFATGGAPVKKATCLADLLRESADLALAGSKARCDFSLPEDLWAAEVDAAQIGQVISNLLINADQAMPEGGIIKVQAENLFLGEESGLPLPPGKYVRLTLADQGIGIVPKYLNKIFDPYFTTKQKGSGLGLATAYSIIKNHSGYIMAESEVGVGTTFYIYLPASGAAVPAKEEEAGKPARGHGRILVMDDEEMVLKVLWQVLTHLGYEVELARDGDQAVDKYAQAKEAGRPYDAVILDLTVPGGMGGKETLKKLQAIAPRVKALVSSGYSDDPIMAHYAEYGFSAVIAKPYKISELSKILKEVIREQGN